MVWRLPPSHVEGEMAIRRGGPEERLCNDWKSLSKAMREGRKLAYLISKHALHVWSSDDPKDGDRCQCAAVRW
jgi:hypothetical protein